MTYSILFIWIAIMAVVAVSIRTGYFTEENGYFQIKTQKTFAVICFLPIIYFVITSTWRYWGDYRLYLLNYGSFPTDFSEAVSQIKAQEDSRFFYVFTYLVKILFGGNETAYRLALTLLQTLPIVVMFRRYSPNYVFSVYMFLVSAVPLAWMLNGVRQLCAAAIIYGATHLYIDKKYVKTVLLILFATMFHQSAILMLPIVFISQGKAWNAKTLLCILGAIVFVVFFSSLSSTYQNVMTNVGYNTVIYTNDDGVHPLRVLVNFVPVALAFWGRKELAEDDSPVINFFTNMALMTFCIYLVAMVTSGILVGRVPLYTLMYNFVFLPYLIDRLFQGGARKMMYFMTIIAYGVYFVLQYGIQ